MVLPFYSSAARNARVLSLCCVGIWGRSKLKEWRNEKFRWRVFKIVWHNISPSPTPPHECSLGAKLFPYQSISPLLGFGNPLSRCAQARVFEQVLYCPSCSRRKHPSVLYTSSAHPAKGGMEVIVRRADVDESLREEQDGEERRDHSSKSARAGLAVQQVSALLRRNIIVSWLWQGRGRSAVLRIRRGCVFSELWWLGCLAGHIRSREARRGCWWQSRYSIDSIRLLIIKLRLSSVSRGLYIVFQSKCSFLLRCIV